MSHVPAYSVIVPVFNRPEEVRELLDSLTRQTFSDFEVVIVEDGSTIDCKEVVTRFHDLNIEYIFKPNSGPGPSRNVGYARARGKYFVVFDSDCIIPSDYFETVTRQLESTSIDAWGGPDRAHENFTLLQRAMGYTMSSVLTTGGIRGAKKHVGSFQPRSFNMGISKEVFEKTGGFTFDRFAEDIEFSIRMKKMGFQVALIPDAFVYHKRRTTLRQFYNQVFNFGRGRVLVGKVHTGEIKLTHWFPTAFSAGFLLAIILTVLRSPFATPLWVIYGVYFALIFIDSLRVNKNFSVAVLSIPSAFIQLLGYGLGFFKQWIKSYIG
jgi:glycosyltransferase involved in cell wall biosynthesis